eukprot:TRINITY_DN13269_c0_g1_i1.p1 TRINITY_DN13269_c0_g1~~TRINITY_DN13269_c0_g1_i1.p1  ORF type:complete len:498 (-),score=119.36 TRINITY_DN13269_c0_g1_i1:433-1926(-)
MMQKRTVVSLRRLSLGQTSSPVGETAVKPFNAIPSISTLGLLWREIRNQTDPYKPFKQWASFHKEFGDLVALKIPGQPILMVFDADLYEQIYRVGGKYPAELQLLCWLERERRLKKKDPNYAMSPIALTGEEWRQNRTPLDERFLKIDRVNQYMPIVNEIAQDLVKLMKKDLRSCGSPRLKELEKYFFKYSVEGIGAIIFNKRLNAISDSVPKDVQEFMDTLKITFATAARLENSVPLYRILDTPIYKRFNVFAGKLDVIGEKFVNDCDRYHGKDETNRVDLVHFLRSKGQSDPRVVSNAVTMFVGGSDSTTHSMEWLIENLGKHPKVQEKLRREVFEVLGSGGNVTPETMKDLRYLKACVKESLRFTPTLGLTARIPFEDFELGGYEIPKSTMVVMMGLFSNKDPRFFVDGDKFVPERWMDPDSKPNPWYHLPFGFGPRMCQGARVSELEIYVLLTHLVRNFSWTSHTENLEPLREIFIRPDKPLLIDWNQLETSE